MEIAAVDDGFAGLDLVGPYEVIGKLMSGAGKRTTPDLGPVGTGCTRR